jgi:hypothetical protein
VEAAEVAPQLHSLVLQEAARLLHSVEQVEVEISTQLLAMQLLQTQEAAAAVVVVAPLRLAAAAELGVTSKRLSLLRARPMLIRLEQVGQLAQRARVMLALQVDLASLSLRSFTNNAHVSI